MSDDYAIRLTNVGKMYKLYRNRNDSFMDAIGLYKFFPEKHRNIDEFWALRGINLELKKGQRIGIIGRNGAGKSTLLKLITGNFPATEGKIETNGVIKALFDTGAGFHPEFTGLENINASLTYLGLSKAEILSRIDEIAEFTELGPFLSQPFKTYSLGMQARLTFAAATVIQPEILIVDEVLGVGDAYFAAKSLERITGLVNGGASVLIVSHDLQSIIRFCDEAIWIERGRVVKRGPSLEVVTAYESFIHTLEDRRIKAKNRKVSAGIKNSFQLENYSDTLIFTFSFQGKAGNRCNISRMELLKNGKVEEDLNLGDVQDSNSSCPFYVVLANSLWSEPCRHESGFYRSLVIQNNNLQSIGSTVCYSYGLLENAGYSLKIRYQFPRSANLLVTAQKNGVIIRQHVKLLSEGDDWAEQEILLWSKDTNTSQNQQDSEEKINPHLEEDVPHAENINDDGQKSSGGSIDKPKFSKPGPNFVRWPSEGSLIIENLGLFNSDDEEQSLFKVGTPMTIKMTIQARRDGAFKLVPAVTLYRMDGILISNFIGEVFPIQCKHGESKTLWFKIPSINLGDADYVFSASIFESKVANETRYDLIERIFQFKVVGNPVPGEIFHHPGDWEIIP